jgi:hypothetical protein
MPAKNSIDRVADLLSHRDIPAKWTYERLAKSIDDFESNLDADHEIGARLVSFGDMVVHIDDHQLLGPGYAHFPRQPG